MTIRLADLEPQFLQHETRMEDGVERRYNRHVETLADASSLFFLCPACFAKNGGAVGTHGIIVTFAGRGVPDDEGSHNSKGKPSRWNVSGTGLADLTLTPSIDVGCWHAYITNGEATL